VKTRKVHLALTSSGPGACGAGQGAKARARVSAIFIDAIVAEPTRLATITCARCLTFAKERMPLALTIADEISRGAAPAIASSGTVHVLLETEAAEAAAISFRRRQYKGVLR
jgi:hypothetical protein